MRWTSRVSLRAKLIVLVVVANVVAISVVAVSATHAARGRIARLEARTTGASYADALSAELHGSAKTTAVFMAVTSTLTVLLCALYTWRASRSIARSVEQLRGAAAKLTAGRLDEPVHIDGDDEFALLAGALDKMRRDLHDVLRLLSHKAALERDLELSAAFQARFLPRATELEAPQLGLVAHYEPATRCGGDFWYAEQTDAKQHLIMVGDVTGHGPAPALVTSAVATALRCAQQADQLRDVNALLHTLSEVVEESGGGQFLMTLSVLRLDPENGKIEWWSTGGPALMKCSTDGETSFVQALGTPLGATPLRIGFEESVLGVGERLLLVTDGILEARLPNGRPVGVRRLRAWLQECVGQSLVASRKHLRQELARACAEAPLDDDVTFVLVERLGSGELRRSA